MTSRNTAANGLHSAPAYSDITWGLACIGVATRTDRNPD